MPQNLSFGPPVGWSLQHVNCLHGPSHRWAVSLVASFPPSGRPPSFTYCDPVSSGQPGSARNREATIALVQTGSPHNKAVKERISTGLSGIHMAVISLCIYIYLYKYICRKTRRNLHYHIYILSIGRSPIDYPALHRIGRTLLRGIRSDQPRMEHPFSKLEDRQFQSPNPQS